MAPRSDTRILSRLSWVFGGLGALGLLLFVCNPDIHAHPQFVLIAGTGLLGTVSLRALAHLLREPPHPDA
ncbi:MAG: hypothetical protein AAF721_04380 [Myxococcota bacterium]